MKAAFGLVVDVKKLRSQGVSRISVELPAEFHKGMVEMFDDAQVLVTIAPKGFAATSFGIIDSEQAPAPPSQSEAALSEAATRAYGEHAKQLMLTGFFRGQLVWQAIGTDADYQAWCRKQPCAITRQKPTEYCHVRRVANGAGMSIKPQYAGVPLIHTAHQIQHANGEMACLNAFGIAVADVVEAKEWFNRASMKHVEKWAREALKAQLGHESWRDVPPLTMAHWCDENELMHLLPPIYKEVPRESTSAEAT